LSEEAEDAVSADPLGKAHPAMISSPAMRAVVQRVSQGSVAVEGRVVGRIGRGLLVLLGVGTGDAEADASMLAEKVVNLRIFPDEAGAMNRSLLDVEGELLVVSQFTLYGDARKGRRPSFIDAAPPEEANRLYRHFVEKARGLGLRVEEGVFRAMMDVALVNEGPVTILLDSRKTF
jgi:D-tyrosyl-tRNA(Tyr) deacylase